VIFTDSRRFSEEWTYRFLAAAPGDATEPGAQVVPSDQARSFARRVGPHVEIAERAIGSRSHTDCSSWGWPDGHDAVDAKSHFRRPTRPATDFLAEDDAQAKETVSSLAREIGYDPVDASPLSSARFVEPLAGLVVTLGCGLGMGSTSRSHSRSGRKPRHWIRLRDARSVVPFKPECLLTAHQVTVARCGGGPRL